MGVHLVPLFNIVYSFNKCINMLRYNNETFEMNGTDGKPCKVRQTTKQGARKAYEDGKDI